MVKSEKRIFTIEVILSIMFFISLIYKKMLNDYIVIIILLLASLLLYFIAGYEKDSSVNLKEKHTLMKYVGFYCIGFIIFQYGLGLLLGFVKSYNMGFLDILKNILLVSIIIIISENMRYMIVKKGEKNRLILVFTIVLFILIDLVLNVNYYDLNKNSQILKFSTIILLPSLFKNIMLTTFTYRYGLKPSILYRMITELYIYIIPFSPDLGLYLQSVFLIILPILLSRIISYGFEKSKKIEYNVKNNFSLAMGVIVFLFVAGIIALNSNLFRFWIVAVGSGSMEPTINVGDVIVVDKSYHKNPNKLIVGDVLVFKIGEKIYTHRITKIKKENDSLYINTKGDRKGQTVDSWIVTNDDIIGVVKYKIKYIGYPTVWLSRILEEK